MYKSRDTPECQGFMNRVQIEHWFKVIVINQMRGLYEIYKSRDMRGKPECQGFMNPS